MEYSEEQVIGKWISFGTKDDFDNNVLKTEGWDWLLLPSLDIIQKEKEKNGKSKPKPSTRGLTGGREVCIEKLLGSFIQILFQLNFPESRTYGWGHRNLL